MTSRLRFVQALCMALALTFVPAILCAVTVASGYGAYVEYQEWRRKRDEEIGNSNYETLAVDREGRGAVAVHDRHSRTIQYLDAQRLPIAVDENPALIAGSWLFHQSPASHPRHPLQRSRDIPVTSLGRFRDAEDWFYVCDKGEDRRAVFEGYDAVARKPIGFIGIDGFHEGPRDESKGFPVDGELNWGAHQILFSRNELDSRLRTRGARMGDSDILRAGQWAVRSGERLFVVDVVVRSVTELLPGTPVHSVAAVARVVAPGTPEIKLPPAAAGEQQFEYQKWLAARTDGKVILLNPDAGRREEYILPPEWKERDFEFYLPSDGTAVLTAAPAADRVAGAAPGNREYARELVAISPAGEIMRQNRFTLQAWSGRSQPSEMTMHWLPTLAVPGPLPSAFIAGGALPWLHSYVNQTRFTDRAAVSLGHTWPVLAFVTLLAAGLTWRADRHLRDCREPRSFFWLTFVFLLGLPGYVAWYCHRRWPVRNPVPPPEKTGTEIFA